MEDRLEIISVANKIYGESGWSFSISNVHLDYIDGNCGSLSAGASAVVHVQLSSGAFREEVGYSVFVGSDKGEVISKVKKNAVTDGLKGALISFGGQIARTINSVPKKVVTEHLETSLNDPPRVAPTYKTNSDDQAKSGSQTSAPVKPATSSSGLKTSPIPARGPHLPCAGSSLPMTTTLPKPFTTGGPQLSDEDLAKIERKKKQQQLQEEFRKKHLQGQAQETSVPKATPQQYRLPLKEQRPNEHCIENNTVSGNDANLGEVDDDVLLSTQDIDAMVEIAANTNTSRHSPMLSSPSIARSTEPKIPTRTVSGQKRPDLSKYVFHPEKKAKEK